MKDTKESLLVLSPVEMTYVAEDVGAYKASKPQFLSFISAITAGFFIAIAFAFYATTQVGGGASAWGLTKLVGGIVFSLGVIMVIVCGAELFTSSTLGIVAKASGRITWFQLLRNWVVVYAGNLVGSLVIVALIWFAGQIMAANGQWGLVILNTAQHKLHHTFLEAFCLGILCNIMVCIGVWMSYAGKTLVDKMMIAILPIAMFVASGFEHCVANMFMIPMGIITAHFASPEFWAMIGVDSALYADITVEHFIFNNLIPVTLGNIVGGAVFIGLIYWYMNIHKYKH